MPTLMKSLLAHPLARPALIVPVLIMIIFSLFTLTAPMDPTRAAPHVTLGVVNLDEGLTMPPIKISERMLAGVGGNLPFQTQSFDSRDAAVAALEAGDLSVILAFSPDFSAKAFAGEQARFELIKSPGVTVAEYQLASQMEMQLPAAMSAGIASIRLAMSQGQMPTGEMPVVADVTSITEPGPMAALQAPFAMLYTNWLAGLVGAILLMLATRARTDRAQVALTRTLVPVVNIGIATLCLSIVVGATAGWSVLLPVWLVTWPTTLALSWFFGGLLAITGPILVIVLLPLAFYQSAIGGVMAPAGAAPEWLVSITSWAGLERIGAAYRAAVHGVGAEYPFLLVAVLAVIGLVLIWIKSLLPAKPPA